MGSLMIVLDTTIVNVALPSIHQDLHFSQTSLAWVVNAYMLTFGGFLLLGGRLGDHFGHRRMFIAGIVLFTAASLACGLSTSEGTLVAARAVQGFGGAIVSAVSLSLIVSLFVEPSDRAKAMGVFGFVAAGGGTLGVLLGGVLTDLLSWHRRNLATANYAALLWAAAMFAWFFLSALYLQLVLGYTPLQVGLAFLPANLIMASLSLGLSAKFVMRFGIKRPLVGGLSIAAAGLALLARAPVDGHYLEDVLPSMILLGFGAGAALNPLLLAAMGDVEPREAGLASGIVNTSFMMGGALGLAILASVAASRTNHLLADGTAHLAALVGGYRVAFIIGAGFAALAAVVSAKMLRAGAIADAMQTVDDAHAQTADDAHARTADDPHGRRPALADASL
jgi:MFS family permease